MNSDLPNPVDELSAGALACYYGMRNILDALNTPQQMELSSTMFEAHLSKLANYSKKEIVVVAKNFGIPVTSKMPSNELIGAIGELFWTEFERGF